MSKYILNQSAPKYLIHTSTGAQFIVNYPDIEKTIKDNELKDGYFKVYLIDGAKLKLMRKTYNL